MRLVFLGTGAMIPTKERNLLSVALEYNGDIYLFDAGESVQKQIKFTTLHLGKIKKIFISHWHGDHVIGLPGLLLTLNNIKSYKSLEIYGPEGTKRFVRNILNCCFFNFEKDLKIFEYKTKSKVFVIYENKDILIKAIRLKHSVPVLGYLFIEKDKLNLDKKKLKELGLLNNPIVKELKSKKNIKFNNKIIKWKDVTYLKKGKRIAFIFDTRPVDYLIKEIKGFDYLVIEATFSYDEIDKAEKYIHMTVKESAEISREANVKYLFLTHFSQRYKEINKIEREAKVIFPNTILSKDLMEINLDKIR